jgi:competence protein ComEA
MLKNVISKIDGLPGLIARVLALPMLLLLVPLLSWAGPVNLNTADAETIARELNGIGEARAKAIVEYRNEYGAFQSREDLLKVAGIGRYILDSNQENILIETRH